MTNPVPRRKVTRAFVLGLAALVTVFGLALLVAAWGLSSFILGTKPVATDVAFFVAPIIILLALASLFWVLWRVALALLRGRTTLPWGPALLAALTAYFLWGILGTLAGFALNEAWFSVYVLELELVWILTVFLFWAVLSRQVFTERPAPAWPWEERERREREQDS
jgi:hypothetical protein